MERGSIVYETYLKILRRELVCAMGCTEPIALAFCAASARAALGAVPDRIVVEASGNIIKNVKSVVVPNTGGRRGMAAAAAVGALGGDENAGLEVISRISAFMVSNPAISQAFLLRCPDTISYRPSSFCLSMIGVIRPRSLMLSTMYGNHLIIKLHKRGKR